MGFWEQLRHSGFRGRQLDRYFLEPFPVSPPPDAPETAPLPTPAPLAAADEVEAPVEDGVFELEISEDEDSVSAVLELEDPQDEASVDEPLPDVEMTGDEELVADAASVTDPEVYAFEADEDEDEDEDADDLIISNDPENTQLFHRPAAVAVTAAEPAAELADEPADEPADADEEARDDTDTEGGFQVAFLSPVEEEELPEPAIEPETDDREAPPPALWPNSLRLPDSKVMAILREENYPHLRDADDETLYQLSRLEESLMEWAVELGEAFLRLQDIIRVRDLWQAAVWVTGMHRDPMLREGLRRVREEGSSGAARWLGWMVWPYTEELLGAAAGLDDPAGLQDALDGLEESLTARDALIRSGPESLTLESARYPAQAHGIFRREGFRWLDE